MHLVGTSRSNIDADYVIMASSTISPSTEVAEASGIELDVVNGGIVVNDNFEVGNGVYAAGVVASYFDPNLGRRRVNRYDHSVNSGLLAGYNMVTSGQGEGIQVRYDHQPAVRSNLEDINVQCESVGECNSDLETVGVWIDRDRDDELKNGGELLSDVSCMSKYRRGVVYYLNNNKVAGVVLWNCSDLLERARDIIRLAPDVTDKRKLIRSIPLAPDGELE
jgi:programmed cell death 8 (apoptosis-inducing factor)